MQQGFLKLGNLEWKLFHETKLALKDPQPSAQIFHVIIDRRTTLLTQACTLKLNERLNTRCKIQLQLKLGFATSPCLPSWP